MFVASTFPRSPNDDVPDFVWRQVRHLSRAHRDIEALVLAPHDREAKTSEVWDGVRIRRFRYLAPASLQLLVYPAIWPNIERAPWLVFQVPFLLVAEFVAALRAIHRFKPAVVYSHWFMPQGVACGLAAWVSGTPHVLTSHSRDVGVMRKIPWLGSRIVRFIIDRARAVTVVSERSKSVLRSFYDADEWADVRCRVAVIPMGVEVNEWRRELEGSAGHEIEDRGDRPRLLFVGRLARKKGVPFLLEALTLEPLRSLEPVLDVLGEGPLRAELEERSRTLGLEDRVEFRGYSKGTEKAAHFREADVVVIPSIVTDEGDAEGMPVVLLEALAAGKICVATDASNAGEVMTSGREGFIVPERDPKELSRTIFRALRLTPEERSLMSDRARERAEDFDWTVIARRHADHLFYRE